MNTMIEFLLARIAERELLARDLAHQAGGGLPLVTLNGGGTLLQELIDPARILADCKAKRALIAHETRMRRIDNDAPYTEMDPDRIRLVTGEVLEGAEYSEFIEKWSQPIIDTPILRILASVDADHPDYRPEWAL